VYIPNFAVIWATYRKTFLRLGIVTLVIIIGIVADLDAGLVAAVAALVAIVTQAFAGLVGLVMLIPWLGPLIIKALSIPLIWILNGAGYFASIVLAKSGHGRSVVSSRVLTVVLISGIVIGYILGKLI
jgi:hypothetical protein